MKRQISGILVVQIRAGWLDKFSLQCTDYPWFSRDKRKSLNERLKSVSFHVCSEEWMDISGGCRFV